MEQFFDPTLEIGELGPIQLFDFFYRKNDAVLLFSARFGDSEEDTLAEILDEVLQPCTTTHGQLDSDVHKIRFCDASTFDVLFEVILRLMEYRETHQFASINITHAVDCINEFCREFSIMQGYHLRYRFTFNALLDTTSNEMFRAIRRRILDGDTLSSFQQYYRNYRYSMHRRRELVLSKWKQPGYELAMERKHSTILND